ncbi:dihydrodipicolinate synthase family protein [Candidatus Aerophobetes bacterium]|nr:dihydrodipicolinate synthase family protein [Candidatus Aerophobetes bacterium]
MLIFKGVVPAIVTPLKKEGREVDLDAFGRYCDFIVEKGVDGLFICGTTGEGPLLSIQERKSIAKVAVERIKGKAKVIIQTGCITTDETVELSIHAQKIGADAVGVLLPYYYNLDDEAMFNHFVKIADAIPGLPLFIYNIPQCTCNNLTPGLFKKLIEKVESIAGIKTSNPDIFQIQEYVRIAGDKCSVFVGCDGLILPGLSVGAKGIVSGNASCFPEPFIEIYRSFERGDLQKAREHQLFIDKLRGALGDGYYVASFKKALGFRGIEAGSVRAPNRELYPEEISRLRRSLKELGLI